jgi:hypothetical protein
MSMGGIEARILELERRVMRLGQVIGGDEGRIAAVEQSVQQSWTYGTGGGGPPPPCDYDTLPTDLTWTQEFIDHPWTTLPLSSTLSKVPDLGVYLSLPSVSGERGWISGCFAGVWAGSNYTLRRAFRLTSSDSSAGIVYELSSSAPAICGSETLPYVNESNLPASGACTLATWTAEGGSAASGGAGTITIAG